jgi:hypothetical protein
LLTASNDGALRVFSLAGHAGPRVVAQGLGPHWAEVSPDRTRVAAVAKTACSTSSTSPDGPRR